MPSHHGSTTCPQDWPEEPATPTNRLTRPARHKLPYKGDCTYYSIPIGGSKSEYAVWTYEKPYEAVADIKDHLAFYPTRSMQSK
jgi:uncharacterized protein (DUF427 family)